MWSFSVGTPKLLLDCLIQWIWSDGVATLSYVEHARTFSLGQEPMLLLLDFLAMGTSAFWTSMWEYSTILLPLRTTKLRNKSSLSYSSDRKLKDLYFLSSAEGRVHWGKRMAVISYLPFRCPIERRRKRGRLSVCLDEEVLFEEGNSDRSWSLSSYVGSSNQTWKQIH